MTSAGIFILAIQRWDRQYVLNFPDILDVTLADVPVASTGKWSLMGFSGKIREWWGSENMVFINDCKQLVPKQGGFYADFDFETDDQAIHQSYRTGGSNVILLHTKSLGILAFTFEDESGVSEGIENSKDFYLDRGVLCRYTGLSQ